jgi:hypothetical protein
MQLRPEFAQCGYQLTAEQVARRLAGNDADGAAARRALSG